MNTGRLEAFSDGVFAIIITIMVLELRVPHEGSFGALKPLWPVFVSYVLSFINVGIYWNNHHHLLTVAKAVDGRVLWANLHLLFWLSLFPFTTGWMGENGFAPAAVAVYGVVLLMAAIAYTILVRLLLALEKKNSTLTAAIGNDFKGYISLAIYATAVALSFVASYASLALYFLVAALWFVPDRRIEEKVVK